MDIKTCNNNMHKNNINSKIKPQNKIRNLGHYIVLWYQYIRL
jgi:hypothetical protein